MTPTSAELSELEKEYLAAATCWGWDESTEQLAQLVDAEHPPRGSHNGPLLPFALWYASLGVPVFPLRPGRKRPAVSKAEGGNGVLDASTDPDVVRAMWETAGQACNIGLATGFRFDVFDIDGLTGHQTTVREWDAVYADVYAATLCTVLTPRPGGLHLYVPVSPQSKNSNAQKLGPGIDYRGRGGYVVAAPSVLVGTHDGQCPGDYRLLQEPLELTAALKPAA